MRLTVSLGDIWSLLKVFIQFPSAVTNYSQLVNFCLAKTASLEAENFGFTPFDNFLRSAQAFRSDIAVPDELNPK